MSKLIKKNKNAIILLHEIYGINQHIKDVANDLRSYDYDLYCPNLLDIESYFDYFEEEKAYNYFMDEVTIQSSLEQVQKIIANLKNNYQKIIVIGYSVGATIAWLCSNNKYCNGVIGFYGSRIRDYCYIEPISPTLLFFAKKEKSFKVENLISKLEKKKNTEIETFDEEHGFADSYCHNYSEDSFKKSKNIMNEFLKKY